VNLGCLLPPSCYTACVSHATFHRRLLWSALVGFIAGLLVLFLLLATALPLNPLVIGFLVFYALLAGFSSSMVATLIMDAIRVIRDHHAIHIPARRP